MLVQVIKKGFLTLVAVGSFALTGSSYAGYHHHYVTTHCWGGVCHRVVYNSLSDNGYHYHTHWVTNWIQ